MAPPLGVRPARQSFRVPLPNGEFLGGIVHWEEGTRPLALLIHGMGGTTESGYLARSFDALARAGFHVAAIDLRGGGTSAEATSTVYHAGLTEDLEATITYLAADRRILNITLIGFSLGGQVSLLLSGKWKDRAPDVIRQVIAVCPPVDLAASTRHIALPKNLVYHHFVLRQLKLNAMGLLKRRGTALPYTAADLAKIYSIYEFDQRVIAPLHGFASADSYYAEVSCAHRFKDIRVPTLLLAAEDDPMVDASGVRTWAPTASSVLRVQWSKYGGHLGFVEKSFSDSWLNRVLTAEVAHGANGG